MKFEQEEDFILVTYEFFLGHGRIIFQHDKVDNYHASGTLVDEARSASDAVSACHEDATDRHADARCADAERGASAWTVRITR